MTDRELLELAAQAACLVHAEWNDHCESIVIPSRAQFRRSSDWILWNPLDDEGDALHLAVTLGICVEIYLTRLEPFSRAYGLNQISVEEGHHGDPWEATRRAIVRAAAQIGKTMEGK